MNARKAILSTQDNFTAIFTHFCVFCRLCVNSRLKGIIGQLDSRKTERLWNKKNLNWKGKIMAKNKQDSEHWVVSSLQNLK